MNLKSTLQTLNTDEFLVVRRLIFRRVHREVHDCLLKLAEELTTDKNLVERHEGAPIHLTEELKVELGLQIVIQFGLLALIRIIFVADVLIIGGFTEAFFCIDQLLEELLLEITRW